MHRNLRCRVRCVDPAQESRSAIRRVALGRGSRCARPGHGRAKSRLAHEPLGVISSTMSNSAVFFVPAARCCARVRPRCSRPSPIEGRAERRQAHLFCCRAGEARPIRTRRGAARPMTRDARLSALHRGDFRPGAALPSPALPPDPCSELLAARSSCLAGGVPDLPSPRLRAAAAGRHSPLRLWDRLRRRPS